MVKPALRTDVHGLFKFPDLFTYQLVGYGELITNLSMKLQEGCVLFGSVTYQASHDPFGNANTTGKEQWRMQWSQRGNFNVMTKQ